jgi:uncharacterized protein (UPF0333 family)
MTKEQKFLLLIVLIVAGASVTYYYKNATPDVTAPQSQVTPVKTPTTNVVTTPTPTTTATAHSFSSDVTYPVPENGSETIHVTVSLLGDTIQDVTFTYDTPRKSESRANIKNFERALPGMSLKGQKLSGVSLSRVGGASLTTNAFMQAISNIRTDAKNS